MIQRQPAHKQFMNVGSRLETFQKFPLSYIKRDLLASAGFFFAPNFSNGESDLCICFCCGVKLYKWEPTDDPWDEHNKYSVDCGYVQKFYAKRPNIQELSSLDDRGISPSSSYILPNTPYRSANSASSQENGFNPLPNTRPVSQRPSETPSHLVPGANFNLSGKQYVQNLCEMPESEQPVYNEQEFHERAAEKSSYVWVETQKPSRIAPKRKEIPLIMSEEFQSRHPLIKNSTHHTSPFSAGQLMKTPVSNAAPLTHNQIDPRPAIPQIRQHNFSPPPRNDTPHYGNTAPVFFSPRVNSNANSNSNPAIPNQFNGEQGYPSNEVLRFYAPPPHPPAHTPLPMPSTPKYPSAQKFSGKLPGETPNYSFAPMPSRLPFGETPRFPSGQMLANMATRDSPHSVQNPYQIKRDYPHTYPQESSAQEHMQY